MPLARDPKEIGKTRFIRLNSALDRPRWERIKARVAEAGLTFPSVLLAAFSDVLNTWSRKPKFTINLTLFNGQQVHLQVNDLVGNFTSLTLLSVDCSQPETFLDFVGRLQKQLSEDLPLFALDENCRLVHSLLGGLIEANQLTDTIVPVIGRSEFVLPSDEREEGEI